MLHLLQNVFCCVVDREVFRYFPSASVCASSSGRDVSIWNFRCAAGVIKDRRAAAASQDLHCGARLCAGSGHRIHRESTHHAEGVRQTSSGRCRRLQQSEERVWNSDWYLSSDAYPSNVWHDVVIVRCWMIDEKITGSTPGCHVTTMSKCAHACALAHLMHLQYIAVHSCVMTTTSTARRT